MNMCIFYELDCLFFVLNSVFGLRLKISVLFVLKSGFYRIVPEQDEILIYVSERSSLADMYNYISSQSEKIQQNCDFMTGFCETYEETFRLPAGTS